MKFDHRDQIDEIIDKASDLEEGPGQVALAEEAVRLADTHQDDEAGFHARKFLTRAATFGGRPDVALVSFSWCLAKSDEDPVQFPGDELLWQHKWVVGNITPFPHISRQQIEELLEDMERRFAKNGSTLHAVHGIRRDIAVDLFDKEMAVAANKKFESVWRDHLSDCPACVNDATIGYHIFMGDDAEAVATARPALEGKMTCGEVPHRTYAYVLLPLVRMGKYERAAKYYRAGYKMVKANDKFIKHKAYHLAFLALSGNLDRALTLFERHLGEAVRTPSISWRFEFYLASRLFIDRLAGGKAIPMLRMPEELRKDGDAVRPATAVAAWLDGELAQLAAQFDARNGNDAYTRWIGEFRDLAKYAKNVPLSG